MPYRITWKKNYVIFEYYGAVTSNDILESNQVVYGDPRFDDLRWELVVFEQADSVAFRESDIRSIAYMDRAAAQSNRTITVAFVGESSILEEAERIYLKTGIEPIWKVTHFATCDEALKAIEED